MDYAVANMSVRLSLLVIVLNAFPWLDSRMSKECRTYSDVMGWTSVYRVKVVCTIKAQVKYSTVVNSCCVLHDANVQDRTTGNYDSLTDPVTSGHRIIREWNLRRANYIFRKSSRYFSLVTLFRSSDTTTCFTKRNCLW